MDRFSSRSVRIGPKVYKNRRIEDKWGLVYHKAVQNTVFGKQCLPYTPTEPPVSLCEEVAEPGPLYVCQHCKDCFRFESSFEDHNTRHSWILGFWCHNCFETVCTHTTNGRFCTTCAKKINEKRSYLRVKGLLKSQRMGVTKVFYNQCQFIKHLKGHQLSSVNMGDLMLIPLPLNMSNSDWSSEFEILCEALMEQAFLVRTHIIDWLKKNNLQDNWWKSINGRSNDTMISEIVNNYQGRQLFESCSKSRTDALMNYNSSNVSDSRSCQDIELIDNNSMDKNTNSYSTNTISDQNVLENEDNPCTSNDITFVDCGPTSQCFEPEIPVNYVHRQVAPQEFQNCYLPGAARIIETTNELFKDRNSHEIEIRESPAMKATENYSKWISETGVSKIPDNSVKISIPYSAKKNPITKTNLDQSNQNFQTSRTNIISIQDPKNVASIINQVSPHLISNNKVVVIGQDSCNIIAHNENNMIAKKDSSNSVTNNGSTSSNIASHKMCNSNIKKQEITENIIINNGKKYIIKRTKNITKNLESSSSSLTVKDATKVTKQLTSEHNVSKPRLTSTDSNEVENTIGIQITSPHDNILTPSPSPELSTSSNSEQHVKKILPKILPKLQKVPLHLIPISPVHPIQKFNASETISLIVKENGILYMDTKVNRVVSESNLYVCDRVIKCRKDMFAEFRQMNKLELIERLEHLQYVSEEMRQVLNFLTSSIFKEKLRAVNTFQCILEDCLRKCNQDIQNKKNDDIILNEWETKISRRKCPSCNKFLKPESYIVGFSKLSKNDNKYCSCYKQVCHECLSYQGSTTRFTAHQNFHKKRKPYICPDCNIKFDSITSLEIHTWTTCFHISRKHTFTCRICEIDGFRDLESITRHYAVMHGKTMIACENCFQIFNLYSEYLQHCIEIHPSKTEQNPIRLIMCKISNIVFRSKNYMSYLENYHGVRKIVWCKCPFCELITTDNKYVTRLLKTHLRNMHIESLSKILSKKAFIEIFGTEAFFLNKNMQQIFKKVSDDTFTLLGMTCVADTTVPKIVNTRTISSESFERGSQNMEHSTWSTDTDEIVNESLQTMKKIDIEKRELLPKIISVRSMSDLKVSKEAITEFSTETEIKSNSSFLQVAVQSDRKIDSYKEISMELDDSKKETAKTKELDKDNELITSYISESEKLLLIDTVDNVRINSSIISNKQDSNSTSEASTENRIKIVDFRTICKPDIEQVVIAEMCGKQTKNKNTSYMVTIPKPPPLARLPKHLLEPIVVNESEDELANNSKESNEPFIQRVADNSKMRIALGSDTHKKRDINYLCHLCNERINTSQMVMQAHFHEKHSDEYKVAIITPQLSRMSNDFINGGYKKFINNKKRKSDSALFVSKRKRRWTPKKHIEIKDANPPVGLCVEQETAEDGKGNFICKKCGQRCSDMSNLREHIAANHRLKGRYLICLECGENFVVAPSLQMHLKAFHGIEDPISYMNQNPSYAPSFDSDLRTEERTTVANQCYVCMAVFEDKAAVDKHLRVHGMAFLNRKRIEARNALEKKANIEEDKQNIKVDSKETVKRDKLAETILEKINAAI